MSRLRKITSGINEALDSLGVKKLSSPNISISSSSLQWKALVVPKFDTSKLAIPSDVLQLTKILGPVVEDFFEPAYSAAYYLFTIGFGLAVIPICTLIIIYCICAGKLVSRLKDIQSSFLRITDEEGVESHTALQIQNCSIDTSDGTIIEARNGGKTFFASTYTPFLFFSLICLSLSLSFAVSIFG
jgi:hypothetical protein